MNRNSLREDWFFPIHEAPVLATITHKGEVRNVPVPHKKALVAADTGHIVGIFPLPRQSSTLNNKQDALKQVLGSGRSPGGNIW